MVLTHSPPSQHPHVNLRKKPDSVPNNQQKKSANSGSSSNSNSNEPITKLFTHDQLGEIATMVAELLKPTLANMVESIMNRLFEEKNAQQPQIPTPTQFGQPSAPLWGQPPASTNPNFFVRMINNSVLNSEVIKEKSMRAVVEKLSEEDDAEDIILQVAKECGVDEELIKEDIHRHPRNRENMGRDRIVKVPFRSQKARDIFIYNFRKGLKKNSAYPQHLSVRRDMTRTELEILYAQRKQAFQQNQTEGLYKYIVVDLEIRALKKPQTLRTKPNHA